MWKSHDHYMIICCRGRLALGFTHKSSNFKKINRIEKTMHLILQDFCMGKTQRLALATTGRQIKPTSGGKAVGFSTTPLKYDGFGAFARLKFTPIEIRRGSNGT